MNLKKMVLPMLVLSLFSTACVLDYENNQRILISGEVSDAEGKALENIPVYVSADNLLSSSEGSVSTNSAGGFQLVILKPKDLDFLTIRVNDNAENKADPRFDEASIRVDAIAIIANDVRLSPVELTEVETTD